jgi:hypothetical protein
MVLYKDKDIVTFIKLRRLSSAGHVIRMEENGPAKRILISNPEGTRGRGQLKIRWEDRMDNDSKAIRVWNWKSAALNQETWDKQLRKALALGGLLCQG